MINNQVRNKKIAEYLGFNSAFSIRRIEEWENCYYVLPVVGRPVFVSKAVVKQLSRNHVTTESRDYVITESIRCKVLAVTKPRPNRFAGTYNTGVLLMDINTRGQFWIRHYHYQEVPLRRGDVVQFDTKWQSVSDVFERSEQVLQNV